MALTYLNANEALPNLLQQVLIDGERVDSRNGATLELTMQQITLEDPAPQKEITVPGRKVSLPAQIAETMWILSGSNDAQWLSHYLPRALDFSDDGKHWRGGYGPRLRAFSYLHDGEEWAGVDQLAHIVSLLNEDPETRRAVFNIYSPGIDTQPGKDIPCNNWVHFLPRNGTLHAHVAIRSNDLFWGWSGINAFEWTSLLQVVAGMTGMKPGSVTFSISSLHLYERHWDKARTIVQDCKGSLVMEYLPSPQFDFQGIWGWDTRAILTEFDQLIKRWFQIEGQIRKGGLSDALIAQVDGFPEPMFRSWLKVLLAWHHEDLGFIQEYKGTALYEALKLSPKRKKPEAPGMKAPQGVAEKMVEDRSKFTAFVKNLHAEKNQAYGNSWMKRGEMLGIMANCARKVDRLGVEGGGDTAADTAIDLLVYFIKYDIWLDAQRRTDWADLTEGQPHVEAVNDYLDVLEKEKHAQRMTNEQLIASIKEDFDKLEPQVEAKLHNRDNQVKRLIVFTYPLAIRLWAREQRMLEMKTVPTDQSEGAAIDAWKAANAARPFNGYAHLDGAL